MRSVMLKVMFQLGRCMTCIECWTAVKLIVLLAHAVLRECHIFCLLAGPSQRLGIAIVDVDSCTLVSAHSTHCLHHEVMRKLLSGSAALFRWHASMCSLQAL